MSDNRTYETKEDKIRKAINARERRLIMEQLQRPCITSDNEDVPI